MTKIVVIDCVPEIDPYHQDTQQLAYTQIEIDPQTERVWVTQEYDTNSTSVDLWNGVNIASRLGFGQPMDAEQIETFLQSEEGEALLHHIYDGHEVYWDGSNHVGHLDDEAKAAWDELLQELNTMTSDIEIYTVEDWFGDTVSAPLTKEEIEKTVLEVENNKEIYLIGDVRRYLEGLNDEYVSSL